MYIGEVSATFSTTLEGYVGRWEDKVRFNQSINQSKTQTTTSTTFCFKIKSKIEQNPRSKQKRTNERIWEIFIKWDGQF